MSVDFFPCSSVWETQITCITIGVRCRKHWLFLSCDDAFPWGLPFCKCRCGETPNICVTRCLNGLFPEKDITPVAVSVYRHEQEIGMLYYAESDSLPADQAILLSDTLPEELFGDSLQRRLYDRLQGWCNVQTSTDELWDVYDRDRNLTGRTHRRGDPLAEGEYHLTVHVWLQNTDGRLLITKRAPTKGYAGLWECTGGSALAGDDSLKAAIREVAEETGLSISAENGQCILQRQDWDWFNDVWLFRQSFDTKAVVLQPGETCDYRWATSEEILEMDSAGEMVPFAYLREFLTGGILNGKRDR